MKLSTSRNLLFYLFIIGAFGALIYWIASEGTAMEAGRSIVKPEAGDSFEEFVSGFLHNLKHPLAILLAQIVSIILAARFFGWICQRIGQPSVVGEIIAGIVLGPSLVGLYWPEFSAALFPAQSLGNLQFLSQVGLILFMFIVGIELDLNVLKTRAHEAVVISHASIIIPFALGMGLSYFIYESLAPQNINFLSFSLFMGIATSITAFPVLARIVQERGIHKTRLGAIAITCAAADDITAWCILATVIAIVKAGSFQSSIYVVILALVYVFVMIKLVRPFLKRIGDLHASNENLSKSVVGIFIVTLILSSYAAEIIGIHALFGAFMMGAIMPESPKFRSVFIQKVEDVAVVLLLPLFFVFTGLRTQIGLLDDPALWKVTGFIILTAVAGKFVGSAIAAKFVGQSWKDSLTLGALMNTRGLMELVVLNIGYDLGVLGPEIFAMMVIMALVTTIMTGPALDIINWSFKSTPEVVSNKIREISQYKILISFANPETGRTLLRLANSLMNKVKDNSSVTAMHLSAVDELHYYNMEEYERETFLPVENESQRLKQPVVTLFKATNDIESEIAEAANTGNFDLLLIGLGQSIFEGSLLGKVLGFTTRFINPGKLIQTVTRKGKIYNNLPFDERTVQILTRTKISVGILIDKKVEKVQRIFMPLFSANDAFLIQYAQKFIHNAEAQIIVLDAAGKVRASTDMKELIHSIEQKAPNHIAVLQEKTIDKSLFEGCDLMVLSLDSWRMVVDAKSRWLSDIPSTLILSHQS
ncbi:cation:proton antiporter [Chryseolinea sp. T2]|uniref:cation:proton antiporter domain-containing protein n=1 Tax=Chryseolinea sp. T2 TaxID=3129255 RepID=UPI003076E138